MKSSDALWPLIATLLSLMIAPPAVMAAGRQDVNDATIRQVFSAVERADGYHDLLETIARYENIFSSKRTVELVDQLLALDCRQYGAKAAVCLLSVRLMAGSALSAESPEQLGRDWPKYGALAAATRMAQAAYPAVAQTADPSRAQNLIGHWRNTRIIFDSPRDEHMVLRASGSAEKWSVTASRRSGTVRGRWGTQANTLRVDWEDGEQWSRPFTFHEGKLVFPNIQNQRKFWGRIE